MGRPSRLSNEELYRLVYEEGLGDRDIADRYGLNRATICNRRKRLEKCMGKTIATTAASTVVDPERHKGPTERNANHRLLRRADNALQELENLKENIYLLLDLLTAWDQGTDEEKRVALQVLESSITEKQIKVGDETITLQKFKFTDPRVLRVRCVAEIRHLIEAQSELMAKVYSIDVVRDFMREVVQVVSETDPDTRDRLLRALQRRRLLFG